MEDSQLESLRRDPSSAFAARLQASLREHEASSAKTTVRHVRGFATAAAIVAVIAGLLSVPSVRASAQSFLALFRVVNFVAVPVDENRLATLQAQNLDFPHLIGEHVQVLQDSGPPTGVASPEQAGATAGFAVRVPAYVPTGAYLSNVQVTGTRHLQITPRADRLRQVMEALAISDLDVPQEIDGKLVDVHVSPVVMLRYDRSGALAVQIVQTKSPEVSLPDGVDLRVLGEIGLRILGLPPVEAHEFAGTIDWQSTLIVPLPPTATSFKQVVINGHKGVAIERTVPNPNGGGTVRGNMLLWSSDGMVFGIDSTRTSSNDLLQMAESLQ